MRRVSRFWTHVRTYLLIVALFVAVNFLPPDTSLSQVRERGVLRVCVPESYPPLVVQQGAYRGVDVDIVAAVADALGVRLNLSTNPAMGRDWNPRNWNVRRAQCSVLAGGVVSSRETRSFLETTPAHLATGWAIVLPAEVERGSVRNVAFFSGIAGLDRIALSGFLRDHGVRAVPVRNRHALADALAQRRVDAFVTEAVAARHLAGQHGWRVHWLTDQLETYPIVFGLWKGDITLKRAFESTLRRLEEDGTIDSLMDRYDLVDIQPSFM